LLQDNTLISGSVCKCHSQKRGSYSQMYRKKGKNYFSFKLQL
jgi:hypothetical protein